MMAKRYSLAAGKVIDVPDPKGPNMDIEKRLAAVESGDRIKALEEEVAMLRASNRQLMRECDALKAQVAQAASDLAAARSVTHEPMAPPVVNVPAPVVNVPAPVVNIPSAPREYAVRIEGRDGMGRPLGWRITTVEPLKL